MFLDGLTEVFSRVSVSVASGGGEGICTRLILLETLKSNFVENVSDTITREGCGLSLFHLPYFRKHGLENLLATYIGQTVVL